MTKRTVLPLIPLRGLTVFPTTVTHFDVSRQKSIAAVEDAVANDDFILLATQKSSDVPNPKASQIYKVGCLARIHQVIELPDDLQRIIVTVGKKVTLTEIVSFSPFYAATFEVIKDKHLKTPTAEAFKRRTEELITEHLRISDSTNHERVKQLLDSGFEDANVFCYNAASIFLVGSKAQELLEEADLELRYQRLYDALVSELEIAKIERRINNRVRMGIDKGQKEYYLREQIRVIQDELGDGDDEEEYEKKINELPIAEEHKTKLIKDLTRADNMSSGSPEYAITHNYLDFILELPWEKFTEDNNDLVNAAAVLDEDHYGLNKIKERIIEFLAVRQLTTDPREPILCLVGPPGVGKTSIVKSIARALGRKYVRMSLGGVHDEAEIRGHRKTYIGAMAGRVISSIKLAGSANPVFLFDEIDKLASDYRGDPASALLEVLDPEQNNSFRDNYLEIPFDLSKVIFITTANSPDSIPAALYDRMEIIEMSGYTPDEKFEIAKRHLLGKQFKSNGIPDGKLEITDEAIRLIITGYTRESGVRGLEKQLATVMRKVARHLVENPKSRKIKVTAGNLKDYLGAARYSHAVKNDANEVGAATGLAWTAVGGEILTIEASLIPGKGDILLTGYLGDVMKESARTAISFIHSHAAEYGIDDALFKNNDIHIHIPEGAIPKDGPSAGITMATAVLSALTGKGIRSDVAMTGEITLRGKVLPIGGIKEKTLAAHRAGIDTVLMPEENKKDREEIPESVAKDVKIIYVKDMPSVFKRAIVGL